MEEDEFFGQFFRPFSFTNMFEDQQFSNIPQFFSFDPTVFATNFSSNFRSFGDDILERIIQMSQQEEAPKRPAKKEAVQKLPIVKISE